ncbi:MAG TPA: hypothetical protein VLM89_15920 [Phycisphaerae bacterium]|nr:hypothetical protein [Phycisphaerae bacterium]
MRKYIYLMTLCATLGTPAALAEVPAPAIAPTSWELRFRYHDPQRVAVMVPGRPEPVVYWYMLYSVENPGDKEIDFYPRFDLVTDTLKVVHGEIKVSPEAFQAIQRRSNNPLLVTPEKALGTLRCGQDQARHSVAIWRDFDPQARTFTVFVSGLSGEFKRVPNPIYDPNKPEDAGNKRFFLLRKTLEIPYKLPAGVSERAVAVPQRLPEQQKWIMR